MICPNLSDPTIRKQFNELKSALGEPIAYYIWDKNQGYPLDLNSDGTPSDLFNQMVDLTGDRKKAIQAVALTFSNKYKKFTPTDKKESLEANSILTPGQNPEEIEKKATTVLAEIGATPEIPIGETDQEVAESLVAAPEETVETVISQTIEEEVTTEEDRKELQKVHKGKAELIKKVKELIQKGSNKVIDSAIRAGGLFGRVVSKVLNKLKKAILILAVGATALSFSADSVSFSMNTLIERSTSALPQDWKQSATRQFVKWGMYDVSKKEAVAVYKESKQKAPVRDTVSEFTEVVGTVKDELSNNPTDSLVMIRNQFDNSKGYTYLAGPMKSRTPQGYSVPNAVGVAHFLILDDQGVDLSTFTSDQELKAASDLFKKRIGQDIKPTDYIPTFTRNENGVTVKYKKASDVTADDIVLTKLINHNFTKINFNSEASAAPFGFSNNFKTLANEDGQALPSFLFSVGGKNKYGRFSGGSVVFIFQDKFGNTIVRDFTGSLEMIEKEGKAIVQQYKIKPENLTVGVFDAASYVGKPKAKQGEIKTTQYSGYNTVQRNSGGALIIPRSTPSPNKGLMLLPLLALLGSARRRNQPIYQQDIDRVLSERERLKELYKETTELDKLLAFLEENELQDLDKVVSNMFRLAASKSFPAAQKKMTEEQKRSIRSQVKQQREFRKDMELNPKAEAQALLWFKTSPISRIIALKNLSRLVNQYGFAAWTPHAVTLYKGSLYSDLYHEAWHEFTQMYLTHAERIALYEEVRKKTGEFNGVPFAEMSNKEVEEYLAEGFRNYAYEASTKTEGEEARKPKNFVERLFKNIWNFLNWLIGKNGQVKQESKDIIAEAYKQLYSGTYTESYSRVGESEFKKLYSGAIIGHYASKETLDWGEEVESRITSGELTNIFLPTEEPQIEDGVFRLSNGTTIRVVSSATDGGRNYTVDVINDYRLDAVESREIFKAFDYFFFESLRNITIKKGTTERKANLADLLADETGQLKKAIYDYIQSNMAVLYEERKQKYQEKEGTEAEDLYSMEKDQFLTMFLVLNNFEAISAIHFKELQKVVSEIKDDIYEIEGEARNKEDWAVDLGDIDPIDNADPLVYTILKGLPDLTPSYAGQESMLNRGQLTGLPQTGDFNRNWNILLDILTGTSDYNTMIARIQETSKQFPQFQYLLDQMPASVEAAETIEDLRLIQALVQSIGVELTPWGLSVRQKRKDNGVPGFEVNLHALSTTAAKKIRKYLDDDFVNNPERAYRTFKNSEPVLDLDPIIEKYYPTFRNVLLGVPIRLGQPTVLEFYAEVFGMDFIPFQTSPEFKKISAKLNTVFLDLFKRTYVVNKENIKGGVRKPFGFLAKNYSAKVLKDLQEKYATDTFFKDPIIEGTKKAEVKPITNFRNDLDDIFKYYDRFYKIYGDKSFLNQEGNLQFSIVPYSDFTYQLEQFNAAKTVDDLAGNLQTSHIVTSTFAPYSLWLGKTFNEDGTRKMNSGNRPVEIKPINWAGPTVMRETATAGKGKKTSNLKSSEKFVNDFFSFLRANVFENIRFGAKNTSIATVFTGSISDAISFPEKEFMTSGGYFSPDFESQLLNYLAYELEMYFKGDQRFIIFSTLVSKELQEELLSTIQPLYEQGNNSFAKRTPARKALFREGKNTLRDKILTEAQAFFRDQVSKELKGLAFALIPNAATMTAPELQGKVIQKLSETLEEPLAPDTIERKLLYYISNYFAHQVELVHLFIANPRNYQTKGKNNFREAFKRFGLTSSPGRQPLISQTWIDQYNKLRSRELEVLSVNNSKVPGREDLGLYDNKIRFAVAKDVFTNENNSDAVREYYKAQIVTERRALGKKKLTAAKLEEEVDRRYKDYTKQAKEADAQAWGNLDFMRMYLDSIRRWTPAMEAAYQFEKQILTKLLAYRQEKDTKKKLALWNELQALRYEATYGQIPSLKLGLYGSAFGFPDSKTAGKFSVHTLLPSVVMGTDLEEVMLNMYNSRTDLFTFQSGSKLGFPAEVMELYNKDKATMSVNPIGENNIATFSIESLREQQYIAPKFKGESTLGTQFVKLIFGDFYDSGEFSEDFPEEVKEIVQTAQREFADSISTLVALEKENLAYESGVLLVNGVVTDVNKEVFYNWLKKQGEKRDTNEDFINFASEAYEYSLSLDSIGFRNFVESILTSVINKRLIRPKVNGEAYIQTASTGYSLKSKRFTNATAKQLLEYGTNGLRDYRIEDGKVQPADCKVAFNPKKHSGLLNLTWQGEEIRSVNRLNQALLDDDWVKEHSSKLLIIGVRIPTQKFNSMEYFRIREFLPTAAGAVMIVPPSIVTKSGSDFDIDKLFMYEPTIDENGNLVDAPLISKSEQQRDMEYYRKQIDEINAQLEIVSAELLSLPAYKKKEELKQQIESLKFETPPVDLSQLKGKKKVTLEELQLQQSQTSYVGQIKKILKQIEKVKKDSKEMAELYVQIDNLKTERDQWYEARNLKKDAVKDGVNTIYNKMIKTVESVLSHPALFEELTKPNNNDILIPIIERFYKKINRSMEAPITGTQLFFPAASTIVHKDALEGKKPLGIVAKMNALQKLYQQSGLKWEAAIYNQYFLDHQEVGGKVTLGAKYSKRLDLQGNKVLISDIMAQFVNGHVDIEKEDWINRIRSDEQKSPLYMQMVAQGTSVETSIIVLLQPILNEYFARVDDNIFQDILYPGQAKKTKEEIYEIMLLELVQAVAPGLAGKDAESTVFNILSGTQPYRKFLQGITFDQSFASYPISLAGREEKRYSEALKDKDKNIPYLKTQLAIFAQLYVIMKQNNALVKLNQNIDFNTMNYSTLQEMYNNQQFLRRGEIDGLPIDQVFEPMSLNKLISSSVVSPFNVGGFGVDLYSRFYDVTGNPRYLEALHNHYTEEGKDQYGPDYLSRYVNKFNNDFILSLFQNGVFDDSTMMEYYPQSLFGREGLPAQLEKFKQNPSPEMKKLFQNNNFLKYLTFRAIEGTEYFYPALAVGNSSKESKDDFIAQLIGLSNAKFTDLALEEEFGEFVNNLALGTIIQKGFISKLDTIQAFTSYRFFSSYLNQVIDGFQNILANPEKFQNYFNKFVEQFTEMNKENYNSVPHFKDFSDNLRISTTPGELIEAPEPVTTTVIGLGPETKINIYFSTGENAELSNFANRPFKYAGFVYTNVEQAFQHIKWQSFGIPFGVRNANFRINPEETIRIKESIDNQIGKILNAKTGAEAKKLGGNKTIIPKKYNKELLDVWDANSSRIMKVVLRASFEQNPDALARLLATGNATLTHTQDTSKWKTEFPRLLMEVREELRATQPAVTPKIEVIFENYTPELLKANPNKLFLFGDNNQRTGKGGQAIIRDEPNAIGISTKLLPKNTPEAFMSDNQLAENKAVIDSDIKKAKERAAKEGMTIVLPKGGFGTGLAALATKAPQTFAYLNQRLQDEFGFNNTTGEITPTAPTQEKESPICNTAPPI